MKEPVYRHMMAILDGSETREQVLPHVITLAEKFDAKITLLMLTSSTELVPSPLMPAAAMGGMPLPPTTMEAVEALEAQRQTAADYMMFLERRLRKQGLDVRAEEAEANSGEYIAEHAVDMEVDLIALTTFGRGGLSRVILGSLADEVARHAHCPVLLIKVNDDIQAEV